MPVRLTAAGRNVRNKLLKAFLWTTCAVVVLRGCIGALSDAGKRSDARQQAAQAAAQSAAANEPVNPYPWKDAPWGSTLTGPWRNTTGQTVVLDFSGRRVIALNGDLVTISGGVVYDKRYKCKAMRVQTQESDGHLKPIYFMLSHPTPASFFDCTPNE